MLMWCVGSWGILAQVCDCPVISYVPVLYTYNFGIFCHSYTVDATAYSSAHFGQDTSIIIALGDVACTTAQSRLMDCTHDSNTTDCSHSDDAGVQCVPSELADSELRIPI